MKFYHPQTKERRCEMDRLIASKSFGALVMPRLSTAQDRILLQETKCAQEIALNWVCSNLYGYAPLTWDHRRRRKGT